MKNSARAGFTVVEVLIAVTIMLAVFGAAVLVQSTLLRALTTSAVSGSLDEKARRALDAISTDGRWAEGASFLITQENGADRLDLRTPVNWVGGAPVWSANIIYRVEPSGIDANENDVADDFRFVRIQSGRTRVLCNNVVAGGFDALRTDDNVAVQIQLAQFQGNTSRTLTANAQTSFSLRN